jgi:hypothetical protein
MRNSITARYRAVAGTQPVNHMIVPDAGPRKHHRASRRGGRPRLEATMSQAVPTTHPAVVLRSHYTHLRALFAAAMIAVLGLSAAVVVLATDDERSTAVTPAAPLTAPDPNGTRYDGGPDEGTRGTVVAPSGGSVSSPQAPGVRYDGGPEEGSSGTATSDLSSIASRPGARYDGGPEEGSRGAGR